MVKQLCLAGCVGSLALALPAAAQPAGDTAACANPDVPSALVRVTGLKNGAGRVRVQAYGPNPRDFLEKGRYARRVEVALNGRRQVEVCVRLPHAGSFAIAVRHDANANGDSDWNDGGGFSRNPSISLLRLKPSFAATAVRFGAGSTPVRIVMNYRSGLSIGPVR